MKVKPKKKKTKDKGYLKNLKLSMMMMMIILEAFLEKDFDWKFEMNEEEAEYVNFYISSLLKFIILCLTLFFSFFGVSLLLLF